MNSSGLVTPSAPPIRRGKLTGRVKAPLPAFVVPLPSMMPPSQLTVTLRENVAIDLSSENAVTSLAALGGYCQLHDHAGHSERDPSQQNPVIARRGIHRIREPHVVA